MQCRAAAKVADSSVVLHRQLQSSPAPEDAAALAALLTTISAACVVADSFLDLLSLSDRSLCNRLASALSIAVGFSVPAAARQLQVDVRSAVQAAVHTVREAMLLGRLDTSGSCGGDTPAGAVRAFLCARGALAAFMGRVVGALEDHAAPSGARAAAKRSSRRADTLRAEMAIS